MKKNDLAVVSSGFQGWSPYCFSAYYHEGKWGEGKLTLEHNALTHGAASGVQFGQNVIEGCQTWETDQGSRYIFRIHDYYQRLRDSCQRLCMPPPPESLFTQALVSMSQQEDNWSHPYKSKRLYIRLLYMV